MPRIPAPGRVGRPGRTVPASLLADEIASALGLPRGGWASRALDLVFGRVVRRLAGIGLRFDKLCADEGFPRAAEAALENWCLGIECRGKETVPADGPLLVVSNHPGTYDAFLIAACLGRKDLRIIVSDIPFLKYLPAASRQFIFLDPTPGARARAAREGLRHLGQGGAMLLYGTGLIDPDPALSPEAPSELAGWSRSIELFAERAPESCVLPCVVSHTLSPDWARSPLRYLRRSRLDRRRIVEFCQVIQQLAFPGRLMLSPRLSFGAPFTAGCLGQGTPQGGRLAALIEVERRLMAEHLGAFGGPNKL